MSISAFTRLSFYYYHVLEFHYTFVSLEISIGSTEQFVEKLSSSMSDLILLHQERLCFILNAISLIEVPCISPMDPIHFIYALLSFIRTQTLIKISCTLPIATLTSHSLGGLLCYHVLLRFLIPPPSIFSFSSALFGCSTYLWGHLLNAVCHILRHVGYIIFFFWSVLFDGLLLEDFWPTFWTRTYITCFISKHGNWDE